MMILIHFHVHALDKSHCETMPRPEQEIAYVFVCNHFKDDVILTTFTIKVLQRKKKKQKKNVMSKGRTHIPQNRITSFVDGASVIFYFHHTDRYLQLYSCVHFFCILDVAETKLGSGDGAR